MYHFGGSQVYIRSKGIYHRPWKRVTTFAHIVVTTFESRFPDSEFLDALNIIDPSTWTKECDLNSESNITFHIVIR